MVLDSRPCEVFASWVRMFAASWRIPGLEGPGMTSAGSRSWPWGWQAFSSFGHAGL